MRYRVSGSRDSDGVLIGFASTVGGCAHYRAELPARRLALAGFDTCWTDHDLIFGSEGGMGFDAEGVNFSPSCSGRITFEGGDDGTARVVAPDVIVLAAGWVRAHPEVLAAASAHGQQIVCDCDDWPWLPPENPHAIEIGAVWNFNAGEAKLASMRAADAAIVSTPYLGLLMASREPPVSLVRNMIDPFSYTAAWHTNTAAQFDAFDRERAGLEAPPLVIAYRGMLCGFHDEDVRQLRGVLPTDGRVRYVHIGADPRGKTFAEVAAIPAALVEDRQATEFADYPALLAGVDLALIPFARRPFSQAKSNIAGLEWTAAAVPWIAGPHPEYAHLDQHAQARQPRDWAAMIAAMLRPAARRDVLERQRLRALPYNVHTADATVLCQLIATLEERCNKT